MQQGYGMKIYNDSELQERYQDTGLTSHMEDYMEAIAMLMVDNRVVRVKDIAKKLNIKMPSVTAALNKLKDMALIEYEKYGFIELTEKGQQVAGNVYNKHTCISEFFERILLMDPENADSEACRVEHTLDPDTCIRIHRFLDFFTNEEAEKSEWIARLKKIFTKV